MRSSMLALLLATAVAPALAQYKCTAANGAVTFQGTPCFGYAKEQKLDVRPNGAPSAASRPASGAATAPASAPSAAAPAKPESSVDKRMLAGYEQQRQREQLQQAIAAVQDEISRHGSQRVAEQAAVQKAFNGDPMGYNKAMDAMNARYRALDEIDNLHLASARKALADWEKSQPAR